MGRWFFFLLIIDLFFSLWFIFPQFLVNIKLMVFCCQKGADDHSDVVISKSIPCNKTNTGLHVGVLFFCFLTHDAVFSFINPLLSLVAYIYRCTAFFFFSEKTKISSVLYFSHHSSSCLLTIRLNVPGGRKQTQTVLSPQKTTAEYVQLPPCLYFITKATVSWSKLTENIKAPNYSWMTVCIKQFLDVNQL